MIAIAGHESTESTRRLAPGTDPRALPEDRPADGEADGLGEQATELVGSHPVIACAAAAAVGALAAWIIKRKLLG